MRTIHASPARSGPVTRACTTSAGSWKRSFGFVLGIGMLLGGVISKYIWVAVAGFVVMLACAMWALNSYRHMNGTAVGKGQPRPKDRKNAKSAKVSMMERLEERWRRRQERER